MTVNRSWNASAASRSRALAGSARAFSRSRPAAGVSGVWLLAALVLSGCRSDSTDSRPGSEPATESPALTQTEGSPQAAASPDPAADHAKTSEPRTPAPPAAAQSGPAPVIKADRRVRNFGKAWSGAEFEHVFTIRNEGDALLEISRVKPQCGCTLANQFPRELKPGESGEIPVKLTTKDLAGRYVKFIKVRSNDPVTPELQLILRGEATPYVAVSPKAANLGTAYGNVAKSKVVTLTNNTETPLKLTLEPIEEESKFTFELSETIPGKQYQLMIRLVPPYQPEEGSITARTTAVLRTNLSQQPAVEVRAYARIPRRIEVFPPLVSVYRDPAKRDAPTAAQTRSLVFRNHGQTPVKVLAATVDDPAVDVEVKARDPGKTYNVVVQLPAGYYPPDEGRTITLKTDDREQPDMEIRVVRRLPSSIPAAPAKAGGAKDTK